MYVSKINMESLTAIYRLKPAAKEVLEYFTTRQPDENVVTVDDLLNFFQEKRYVIARQDIVNLFKSLEELGVGDFKIGRRTQKTRFMSKISLVNVGRAVVDVHKTEKVNQVNQEVEQPQREPEKAIEVAQETENNRSFATKEATTVNNEEIEKLLTHPFNLRPNLEISLNLPVDFTKAEAQRLSSFINTLPFNG